MPALRIVEPVNVVEALRLGVFMTPVNFLCCFEVLQFVDIEFLMGQFRARRDPLRPYSNGWPKHVPR
jgi:hypothetical protein